MNQLNEFIKMNLTNKQLLDTNYVEDKNIVLNALYKKDFVINDANEFLKNFKSTYTKRNVLNNYSISLNRQKYRDLIINPTDGDVFIDQIGNKFRLVNIYDNKFQFCEEGSFHIYSNGYSSMSGGFSFNVKHRGREIGSITSEEIIKLKDKEYRKFWFFMDNSSGANRGLYFNCQVNVYKSL